MHPGGVPPRPDLDADGHPLGPAASGERRSGRRTRVLAIVTAVALVGAGLSVAMTRDGDRCDGTGPTVDGSEIGVRWVVGHRYCFRVSSSASGIGTSNGRRAQHVGNAVERITFLVRSIDADGEVTATMQVVDEATTIDGRDAPLRSPFEFTVHLDATGAVRSPFGWGVPTGTSQTGDLPSFGQFMPLLRSRTVAVGGGWTETLSFPIAEDDAVTGTFDGRFIGPASVDGHDGLELRATFAMAGWKQELSVDELEREQGAESGLPAGAVYVIGTEPTTIEQVIHLEAESQELLRATLTSEGANEVRIEGLPEGDPRGDPSGFDGRLTLTIERIF